MEVTEKVKKKYLVQCGMRQFYGYYKKHYPKKGATYKKQHDVPYSRYTKIIKEFNKAVGNLLVNEAYEYYMPDRLGTLRIKKLKCGIKLDSQGKVDYQKSFMLVDWARTKALWEKDPVAQQRKLLLRYDNAHTEGYRLRFWWCKYRCNIPNISAYSFVACRDLARTLSKTVKTNPSVDFYA